MKLVENPSDEVISTGLRGIRNLVIESPVYQQEFAMRKMSRILDFVDPAIPKAGVYAMEIYACFVQSGLHVEGEGRCHGTLRLLVEDERANPNMSTYETMFFAKTLALFDAKIEQKDELARLREDIGVLKILINKKNDTISQQQRLIEDLKTGDATMIDNVQDVAMLDSMYMYKLIYLTALQC